MHSPGGSLPGGSVGNQLNYSFHWRSGLRQTVALRKAMCEFPGLPRRTGSFLDILFIPAHEGSEAEGGACCQDPVVLCVPPAHSC